jgi:hypothetical protein
LGSLISIGLLCDHGCTAVFESTRVTIKQQSGTILTGLRSPTTGLWCLQLPSTPSAPQSADTPASAVAHHSANSIITNKTIGDHIAFYHASMYSPTLSTWCDVTDAGRMTTCPELTSAQVRKHPPTSVPMIQGHLDQQRANLCSTQSKAPKETTPTSFSHKSHLLRGSRINPRLSAHAQVHGAFDFNRTPLAPPGTCVLVHDKTSICSTWSPQAVDVWYLGPALDHYRCYRIWITKTSAERIADILAWFPTKVSMPQSSSADLAIAAAQDLLHALRHPSPATPLAPQSDITVAALKQLADISAQQTTAPATIPVTVPATVPVPATTPAIVPPSAPPGFAPIVRPTRQVTFALTPPAPPPKVAATPSPISLAPSPRVATAPPAPAPRPPATEVTYNNLSGNAGVRRCKPARDARLLAAATKKAQKAQEHADMNAIRNQDRANVKACKLKVNAAAHSRNKTTRAHQKAHRQPQKQATAASTLHHRQRQAKTASQPASAHQHHIHSKNHGGVIARKHRANFATSLLQQPPIFSAAELDCARVVAHGVAGVEEC